MNGRRKLVRLLVLVGLVAATGALAWTLSNARQGYEPRQPISFRHTRMPGAPDWQVTDAGEVVNAGGYDIPCVYCHTMPYKGRHSTVPSTAVCMNCHQSVGLGKEWVLRMQEYWERGQPIPWVKVHDLPDFVYYDHSAHLNARDASGALKLACSTPSTCSGASTAIGIRRRRPRPTASRATGERYDDEAEEDSGAEARDRRRVRPKGVPAAQRRSRGSRRAGHRRVQTAPGSHGPVPRHAREPRGWGGPASIARCSPARRCR